MSHLVCVRLVQAFVFCCSGCVHASGFDTMYDTLWHANCFSVSWLAERSIVWLYSPSFFFLVSFRFVVLLAAPDTGLDQFGSVEG